MTSAWPVVLACAELFFLLVRTKDIQIIFKNSYQLTSRERVLVKRGLRRSLLLEMVVFVPASVMLVMVVLLPSLIRAGLPSWFGSDQAFYGALGILSYGFPFAIVK